MLQAVGFGLMPLVREPWQAYVLMAIEGAGSAGFWPSQSTLISRLTPASRRHAAFAQQRLTMNLGVGLGGIVGGLIAHVANPRSFTLLFLLDAVTYLCYAVVLFFIHDPGAAPNETGSKVSYAAVLRHRTFLGLWVLNFMFVAAGYSLTSLFPQFARDQSGISERQIGLVFAVNTGVIVLAQLPLSRFIEGKRRMRALALMPLLWAAAWLLVDATGYWLEATAAFVGFAVAYGLFGIGECFHGPAHQALVADIGPEHLRGRYFAVHSLSWGLAGRGRAGGRRVHPRCAPVRAVAARVARVPGRGGRRSLHGTVHPGGVAPNPARRGGDSGARGARACLTLQFETCCPSSRIRSVPVERSV